MADRYVRANGNDGNPGTLLSPYLTIAQGLRNVSNGERVWLDPSAGVFGSANIGTIDSLCSGAVGNPKEVRALSGTQATINHIQTSTGTSAVSDISFIGHDDVRIGRTADTIKITPTTQHSFDHYGIRVVINGCDVDQSLVANGSCVAMGYGGGGVGYQAVGCKVLYSLIRNTSASGQASNDPGHLHGFYLNWNLDCEIGFNVIENIVGGWGCHLYPGDNAAGRHVVGTLIYNNTIVSTRGEGIGLASEATETTNGTVVTNNLVVSAAQLAAATGYSYGIYWGGPVGSGNTGTNNHGHNARVGNVDPEIASQGGWTLDAPTTGDPLFVDAANHDYRLQAGSPADGKGAFPTSQDPAPPPQSTRIRPRRFR